MMEAESMSEVEGKTVANGSEPSSRLVDEVLGAKENGAGEGVEEKGMDVNGRDKKTKQLENQEVETGVVGGGNDQVEKSRQRKLSAEARHNGDEKGSVENEKDGDGEDTGEMKTDVGKDGEKGIEDETKAMEIDKIHEDKELEGGKMEYDEKEPSKGADIEEPGDMEEENEERGEDEGEEKEEGDDEEEKGNKDDQSEEEKSESKEEEGVEETVSKKKRSGGGRRTVVRKPGSKKQKKVEDLQKTPTAPSIERPVRERKTVERLVEVIEKGPSRDFVIEKGEGTALKDIPNVAYKLARRKPDDIKLLHTILFGRKGKATDFKSHILQFSGFVWHGGEDKQRIKVKEKLDKCVKEKLLDLCDMFDLPISRATTRKEDLVAILLDFLVSPRATTDVHLVEEQQPSSSKKRQRRSSGSLSKSTGSHSSSKRSQKRRAKDEDTPKSIGKKASDTEDGEESDKEDEEAEQEQLDMGHSVSESEKDDKAEKEESKSEKEGENSDKEEAEEVDDKSPKKKRETKKRAKTEKLAESKKTKKLSTPLKAHTPTTSVKSPGKTSSKQSIVEENDSGKRATSAKKSTQKLSSKGKDAGKKGKEKPSLKRKESGPSKAELKKAICEILKEADFNTATFTDILRELARQFKTDLTPKKSAIKLMIQDELTRLAEEDTEDGADDDSAADNEESEPASPPTKKVKA